MRGGAAHLWEGVLSEDVTDVTFPDAAQLSGLALVCLSELIQRRRREDGAVLGQ